MRERLISATLRSTGDAPRAFNGAVRLLNDPTARRREIIVSPRATTTTAKSVSRRRRRRRSGTARRAEAEESPPRAAAAIRLQPPRVESTQRPRAAAAAAARARAQRERHVAGVVRGIKLRTLRLFDDPPPRGDADGRDRLATFGVGELRRSRAASSTQSLLHSLEILRGRQELTPRRVAASGGQGGVEDAADAVRGEHPKRPGDQRGGRGHLERGDSLREGGHRRVDHVEREQVHRRAHHLHQGWGHKLRDGARHLRRHRAARDEQILGGVGHDERAANGQAVARGEEYVGRGGNHGGGGSSGDGGAEEPGERRVLEDGAAHVDAGDDAKLAPLGNGPARAGALDDDVADVLGEVGASVDARDHPERGGGESHLGMLEELRGGREDRARERAPRRGPRGC
mmetsp:Transcript_2070/g.8042  ORF Transcript_2070/g.8042 Transcript_2070/m.8042 type:complete len:401 (+) Transcript_2070:149-1351(+)